MTINKDMLSDKDLEIANLKLAIKKFKEYDKRRKDYYAKSMQRLGELESYFEELNLSESFNRNSKYVLSLKKEVKKLNTYIQANNIPTDIKNLDAVALQNVLISQKKTIKKYVQENKRLQNEIKNLIYKMIHG